jgi:hypothetical protein
MGTHTIFLLRVLDVESLSLIFPIFHESFLLTPGFFPFEKKKYLHRHHVIEAYRFYANWSTETLRNKKRSGVFVTPITPQLRHVYGVEDFR